MNKFLYIVLVIGLIACKQNQTNKLYSKESTIIVENDETILNNYFYQNIGNGKVLAVNEKQNITDSTQIPSFVITPVLPQSDSAKWQLNFNAQQYHISNTYLTTESYLEGKDYTFELYNISNGKKIINYTYDKFEVNYTNDKQRRIVAFYSKNAIDRDNSGFKFTPKTLGYLFYASNDGIIDYYRLDVKDVELKDKYDVSNTNISLGADDESSLLRFNSNKSIFFTTITGDNASDINFNIGVTMYVNEPYTSLEFPIQVKNNQLSFNEDDLNETDFVLVSN